ncbi:MAG: hypothetical protein ACI311_07115 [Bacilli bacterium]
MNNDLEIFNNLYGEDDELVFKALSAKKDWMFLKPLYAKGHINTKLDSKGLLHYPFIESMLDDTLLFEDFKVSDEEVKVLNNSDQIEQILNERFAYLNLYEKVDDSAPFFVEYDFNLIDNNMFNMLFPNFFRKHNIKSWEVDFEKINNLTFDSLIEYLKLSLVGKEGEHVIVMEKTNLINGVFFAPIAKKIIAYKDIDEELKLELKTIAEEKEMEYEERDYDR